MKGNACDGGGGGGGRGEKGQGGRGEHRINTGMTEEILCTRCEREATEHGGEATAALILHT